MSETLSRPERRRLARAIRAQAGPQEGFLASSADIVIYGGAAGGGKSFAILLEPIRHKMTKAFGAVVFRREATQITNEGGLWDEAMQLYPLAHGTPFKSPKLGFRWKSGAKVTFGHLNREDDVLAWQGAQIPLICFDELTHFEESQFWYMLSRNRSTCGVRPYIRATTNPKADSWVERLLTWWIDQDENSETYGLPIPERSGVVRWFVRVSGTLHWGDSPDIAIAHGMQPEDAKSLTFISAKITDNKALLDKDPGYMANLKALSRVERGRLLDGNWKIRPAAGMYFRRSEVRMITHDQIPDGVRWLRAWDLAATEVGENSQDPDWTVGALMGIRLGNVSTPSRLIIAHVRRDRQRTAGVRDMVKSLAEWDTKAASIAFPQDPGAAGKSAGEDFVGMLPGWTSKAWPISGDKVTRADPFAAQWQAGNVDVVRGPWNEAFFSELEAFPTKGVHDDQVDACSLGFYALTNDFRPTSRTTARVRGL